jgi:hypothetical protein
MFVYLYILTMLIFIVIYEDGKYEHYVAMGVIRDLTWD